MVDSRKLVLRTAQSINGDCVIYVMSRDQRVADNFALYTAQQAALEYGVPLLVVFCLYPKSGSRSREQYEFMVQGLYEVEEDLLKLNIGFMMLLGDPKEVLINTCKHLKPRAVYFDFSPLRGPRNLQAFIASQLQCSVVTVDTHNVVPVWVASVKQEVGARTLRPKIQKLLDQYLSEESPVILPQSHVWPQKILSLSNLKSRYISILDSISSNGQKLQWMPGEKAAQKAVEEFVKNRLNKYTEDRNDPTKNGLSNLSPYLHFGHISSRVVVKCVLFALENDPKLQASCETLIEEMVVRKELSDNFCWYGQNYRTLEGAPNWAQRTLQKHATDKREYVYALGDFEQAKTHDQAWNAAQTELVCTGKMHGYMRMYWAKKVLEWSKSPQDALDTLIYLNDFYSIDGGDPNGYTGIMWSVAGVHDRPWGERAVYGTVRCMVYAGLKRKFDIVSYQTRWIGSH